MTKLTLVNNLLVMEATFTAKEFETASAFDPRCIDLVEDDFVAFSVRVGATPNIGAYGVTFQATEEGTLLARTEINLGNGKTKAEAVADVIGTAMNSLDKVTEQINAALVGYDTLAGQIADTMTIVG